MADHDRCTTDGLGGPCGPRYDLGDAARRQGWCELPAAVPCYPAMTYDALADRAAAPQGTADEPDADAPVVVPRRPS